MPKGIYDRAASKQPKTRKNKHFGEVFTHKRGIKPTAAELDIVTKFVKDQKGEILPTQIESLSQLLQRRKDTIQHLIFRAREKFNNAAEEYVDVHLAATKKALRMGDNEQALKGSSWALQNMSADGVRVIDKPVDEASSGVKVMVGVKIGGTAVTVEPIE